LSSLDGKGKDGAAPILKRKEGKNGPPEGKKRIYCLSVRRQRKVAYKVPRSLAAEKEGGGGGLGSKRERSTTRTRGIKRKSLRSLHTENLRFNSFKSREEEVRPDVICEKGDLREKTAGV